MTEEKRNRLVAAATATAILFIVILVAIVIYQLAIISSAKKQKQRIEQEILQYQQLTEKEEKSLEDLQSLWYLQEKLLEYGYHF